MIIRRFPSSSNLRENGDAKYGFKNHNNNSSNKMANNNPSKRDLLVSMHNKLSRQSMLQQESGWTTFILLNEDNIRFFVLAVIIILYMTAGAAVFFAFEEPHETEQLKSFQSSLSLYVKEIQANIEEKNITMSQIEELLYLWGNASVEGIVSSNRKWDYAGSFHFVYTVVSTTGFGATVPKTPQGKIFLIFYGLLGCSSGILFFNLFLERIITVITCIMKANYNRQSRHQVKSASEERSNDIDDIMDEWKPSVYWVIFYLTLFSVVIGALASLMFSKVENWSYFNSVYFSFVTFATIGFGDFVSAQGDWSFYGSSIYAYQFGNFFTMVSGTCCVYSLFNVISITIKQFLNWIIRGLANCAGVQNYIPHLQMNGVKFSPVTKTSKQDLVPFEQNDAERKLSGEIFTLQDTINKKNLNNDKKGEKKRGREARDTVSPVSRNISASSRMLSASSRNFSRESFIPGHVGSIAIASSKLSDN